MCRSNGFRVNSERSLILRFEKMISMYIVTEPLPSLWKPELTGCAAPLLISPWPSLTVSNVGSWHIHLPNLVTPSSQGPSPSVTPPTPRAAGARGQWVGFGRVHSIFYRPPCTIENLSYFPIFLIIGRIPHPCFSLCVLYVWLVKQDLLVYCSLHTSSNSFICSYVMKPCIMILGFHLVHLELVCGMLGKLLMRNFFPMMVEKSTFCYFFEFAILKLATNSFVFIECFMLKIFCRFIRLRVSLFLSVSR